MRFLLLFLGLFLSLKVEAYILYGITNQNRVCCIDTEEKDIKMTRHPLFCGQVRQILATPRHFFIAYYEGHKYYVLAYDKENEFQHVKTINIDGNFGAMAYQRYGFFVIAEFNSRGNVLRVFNTDLEEDPQALSLHMHYLYESDFPIGIEEERIFPFFIDWGDNFFLHVIDYKNRFNILGYDCLRRNWDIKLENKVYGAQCSSQFIVYHFDLWAPYKSLGFISTLKSRGSGICSSPSKISTYSLQEGFSTERIYCEGENISSFTLSDYFLAVACVDNKHGKNCTRLEIFDLEKDSHCLTLFSILPPLNMLCFDYY